MVARASALKPPTSRVFIGNLDERVTRKMLYEIFCQAGPIVSIHMPDGKGKDSKARRFAFCEYEDEETACYAACLFSGNTNLFGASMNVNFAGAPARDAPAASSPPPSASQAVQRSLSSPVSLPAMSGPTGPGLASYPSRAPSPILQGQQDRQPSAARAQGLWQGGLAASTCQSPGEGGSPYGAMVQQPSRWQDGFFSATVAVAGSSQGGGGIGTSAAASRPTGASNRSPDTWPARISETPRPDDIRQHQPYYQPTQWGASAATVSPSFSPPPPPPPPPGNPSQDSGNNLQTQLAMQHSTPGLLAPPLPDTPASNYYGRTPPALPNTPASQYHGHPPPPLPSSSPFGNPPLPSSPYQTPTAAMQPPGDGYGPYSPHQHQLHDAHGNMAPSNLGPGQQYPGNGTYYNY